MSKGNIRFNLTPSHFDELIKQSYSLDHIFLLKLVEANIDIQPMISGSMKIAGLYQSLVRKGLVSDVTQQITQTGRALLTYADSEVKEPLIKKKTDSPDFEKWWDSYPSTDLFTHKGKSFNGSRGLKRSREDCRIKFNKILAEGDYTAKELIDATVLDVFLKKEASVRTGENKMSYLQNSLTYLAQRSFEPFIEMVRSGVTPGKSTTKHGTDI